MIFNPVYGGASEPNLGTKTITANGTYQASSDNLDGYSQVVANVPNTYTASDEGKVVSNGALTAQTSRTVTANGTYDTTMNDEVVVIVPSSTPTLITKTITANGTYNASDDNADGYSQVVVNVSGGGGGREAYQSDSAPTAGDGNVGDFLVKTIKLSTEGANRIYTIDLTPARVGSTNFTYFGLSGIEAIFEDSDGNQFLLSQASDKNAKVKNNNATSYIGTISTGYSETNGTPYQVTFSGTIPSGYALKTLRISQRNSTQWKDYWSAFTVSETVNGVTTPNIIAQRSLAYSDWNGPGTWTDFQAEGGGYAGMYVKIDSSTWIPVTDLTAAQIAALNLTPL